MTKQPHHLHHYQLAQLVAGPPGEPSIGQWFITEVTITSDGYRTRICDGRWPTRERAQAELDYRSGKGATPQGGILAHGPDAGQPVGLRGPTAAYPSTHSDVRRTKRTDGPLIVTHHVRRKRDNTVEAITQAQYTRDVAGLPLAFPFTALCATDMADAIAWGEGNLPPWQSEPYPALQGPDYGHLRGPDWQPEGTPTHWPGPEGEPGPMAYKIGDLTIERVFKPLGITDVADSNMQALWDQIERVLFTALEVH